MTVETTVVFAVFALLIFGAVLVFAAIFDRRRVRRIQSNAWSRAHQPGAARSRWWRQTHH